MTAKKASKVVKKVVKKVAKEVEKVTKPASKPKREVLSLDLAKSKAVLLEKGVEITTHYQLKRKTNEGLVAIAGKPVSIEDWLAGKADLQS